MRAAASVSLSPPVDLEQIEHALELLPRLAHEAQLLLHDNARLRASLAEARAQLRAARAGTRLPEPPAEG